MIVIVTKMTNPNTLKQKKLRNNKQSERKKKKKRRKEVACMRQYCIHRVRINADKSHKIQTSLPNTLNMDVGRCSERSSRGDCHSSNHLCTFDPHTSTACSWDNVHGLHVIGSNPTLAATHCSCHHSDNSSRHCHHCGSSSCKLFIAKKE